MEQLDALHRLRTGIIANQIRVKTAKTGGSGTVVYSRPSGEHFATYALTCHHVVSDAIAVKEEWDSRVGRQRKREYRQLVGAEFFDYENVPHGRRPVSYSVDAEIAAYDKDHDLAILRLRTVKPAPAVAILLPPGEETALGIGSECYAVGAALLHDPILTRGMITHMGDEIDYRLYWMSSAQIIFGNSGGAIFVPFLGGFAFLGVPSRIDIAGWGTPITHLGYFTPSWRVYEFLDEQQYHFLIPGHAHTEAECEQERKERLGREERRLMLEAPEGKS